MPHALPPPNRLRAFEASARHSSFAGAARELNLTAAAVGNQVRLLEAELGAALFERLARGLRLTQPGEAYLPAVRKAFEDLRASTAGLFGQKRARILPVRVPVSFATLWLAPRLERFHAAQPDIELHVFSSIYADGLPVGECDLEVRFGEGAWPGFRSELLRHEPAVAVVHRDLAAAGDSAARLAALARLPRIQIMGLADNGWERLFGEHGLTPPRPWIQVDTSLAALQLVAAGQGAAIVLESFFATAARSLPIALAVDTPLLLAEAHHILLQDGRAPRADALLFRDWLLREGGG
ncbi:LysR substrate-binding domain-containing protein [Labrys wisconsinensis]|uniref:LysR family glycine cleavage system transcriptional activator n=1 Tax=Labrys wisconsinensis TaxID=425677 RepID=A0ABU0JKA2_9HYPH|nr:LysR substrate-binding domain-containing protein [Labrys wisconsinensis]MDQ0474726.1 LysR family glycine cleavage system transcriptional activator [Labrys wisconsinensis]